MMIDVYAIRSEYTTPDNACKPDAVTRRAPIAIAHDIASLVGVVEQLQSENKKLRAEVRHLQAWISDNGRGSQ